MRQNWLEWRELGIGVPKSAIRIRNNKVHIVSLAGEANNEADQSNF